jgi:TrmH family RNA methyltransferase
VGDGVNEMDPIASKQNQRVKDAVRLRDRRGRDQSGKIIIDGVREIGRALEAAVQLDALFVCESLLRPDGEALLAAVRENDPASRGGVARIELVPVTASVFAKLDFGARREGIVAVATPSRRSLVDLTVVDDALVAVVEGVEKGGNLGAVARSADAAGVAAVIAADGRTDLYNPNAIRASAGAVFALPLVAATSTETLSWLRGHGFRILATRVDGAVRYTDADLTGRTAIVLGSEVAGLSDVWTGEDVTSIVLPMRGVADSLNVSVTGAVLFFEALRQRGVC